MERINTLKKQVEAILRDFPESRNSDITLMIELWRRHFRSDIFQGVVSGEAVRLRSLYELPRESAIGRVRRHIQNDVTRTAEMRYLPNSLEVAKQRGINESIWFLAMGHNH